MPNVHRIFDLLQLYRGELSANQCVFGFRKKGVWQQIDALSYTRFSDRISCALIAHGLNPGDKVITLMNNRPEWNFLDMGILQAGCVHVPVYPALSCSTYSYIFADSEARLIVIGCPEVYRRIVPAIKISGTTAHVVAVDPVDGAGSWDEFLMSGYDSALMDALEISRNRILPGDLATIIYTSGTTGTPKGVMLSHANLVSNFMEVSQILREKQVSRALSFLPLCHVYERMLNYVYQALGISVYYADHPDRIRDCLREVKPEMFCAVPRIIEKSYSAILRKGKNLKGIRKIVFFQALRLGLKFEIKKPRPVFYGLRLRLADWLVFRKWRQAFGDNVKFIVSGGAPLNPKLARIFWAAGMKIIEGYGLTETSPVIATGNFDADGVCFGTVGPVLPGVQVKFSSEGEILCRGPNVMLGYYNSPERTAEAIDEEGWFHTGDIGEFVDGKYLKITDRKKEIFKTSGGKYIAPQLIESKLKESPFIENVLVVGENRNFPSALIVPGFDYLRSWCRDKGIEYSTDREMVKKEIVINRINRDVMLLNLDIDHPSQVRKFTLIGHEWSVKTGELSFTMKVRRTHLQEKYAALIAAMYENTTETRFQRKEKKKKRRGRK